MGLDDIYDDLTDNCDLDSDLEKLIEQNKQLREHIETLEVDIEKLCRNITLMKTVQSTLETNISELFKTAKTEIERKDKRIADLRTQVNDLLFRRQNNSCIKRQREDDIICSENESNNKKSKYAEDKDQGQRKYDKSDHKKKNRASRSSETYKKDSHKYSDSKSDSSSNRDVKYGYGGSESNLREAERRNRDESKHSRDRHRSNNREKQPKKPEHDSQIPRGNKSKSHHTKTSSGNDKKPSKDENEVSRKCGSDVNQELHDQKANNTKNEREIRNNVPSNCKITKTKLDEVTKKLFDQPVKSSVERKPSPRPTSTIGVQEKGKNEAVASSKMNDTSEEMGTLDSKVSKVVTNVAAGDDKSCLDNIIIAEDNWSKLVYPEKNINESACDIISDHATLLDKDFDLIKKTDAVDNMEKKEIIMDTILNDEKGDNNFEDGSRNSISDKADDTPRKSRSQKDEVDVALKNVRILRSGTKKNCERDKIDNDACSVNCENQETLPPIEEMYNVVDCTIKSTLPGEASAIAIEDDDSTKCYLTVSDDVSDLHISEMHSVIASSPNGDEIILTGCTDNTNSEKISEVENTMPGISVLPVVEKCTGILKDNLNTSPNRQFAFNENLSCSTVSSLNNSSFSQKKRRRCVITLIE